MSDQKNLVIAIALSVVVLVGWEYFYGVPQRDKARQIAQQNQQTRIETQAETAGRQPAPADSALLQRAVTPAALRPREEVLGGSQRITIDTPRLSGSLALRGGRLDDLRLKDYHETVDPKSPSIVLLSPEGSTHAFYAEYGWVPAAGTSAKLPDAATVWTQNGANALSVDKPVTLTWDNGEGLVFTRTIAVDQNYLFTVTDAVENKTTAEVKLYPYGLVSRHGVPQNTHYYILHEGMIGYLGKEGLQEVTYKKLDEEKTLSLKSEEGWLGITDKYWAAALVPPQGGSYTGRFTAVPGEQSTYQADYLLDARSIAPGASTEVRGHLFAGAKEVGVVDGYETARNIPRFELLIDWGWFYFFTKPLFLLIDWFYRLIGNFGVAILIVTVLVKMAFFPLANKSYVSMAKMKKLQPELKSLRERYPDDKLKQQQEMMDLYRKEKINPMAGCLPMVVQIPVFFALYKVLFVTIEMRHAPFFGWIHDLAAPDPTSLFNLFGLIPWMPPPFLLIGVWPLLMGVTMFVQMQMNPAPPDPAQAMIFTWMPIFFTFLLASFPAGLVIYWSWNNFLSIVQQWIIMRRQGAKVELFDNIRGLFRRKKVA